MFGIEWLPSKAQLRCFLYSIASGRCCTWSRSNSEIVKRCYRMTRVQIASWLKWSLRFSILHYVIAHVIVVCQLLDFTIPSFMTWTVIYHRHRWGLPAAAWAMLKCSGKGITVFNRKVCGRSSKLNDLTTWTTAISSVMLVRSHVAVLQQVASGYPCLLLLTHIHSWWIPGLHYWRATKSRCIQTP